MKTTIVKLGLSTLALCLMTLSCKKDATDVKAKAKDINTAKKASIDRFSASAGHLMVRNASNGLPIENAAINMDLPPFITQGLDRIGNVVKYYNFDVQPTKPDDIYVFFKSGATSPLAGQNNVIPTIPGDAGYSDFWYVNKVTVPDNYIPNSLTSEEEIKASGYNITATTDIVNCPVVPYGSVAAKSFTNGTASTLTWGWYKGMAIVYFNFGEKALMSNSGGMVPTSPIYVMFNDNIVGAASGFKTELTNPNQTHNVLATIPSDVNYSPLWSVQVIDNKFFNTVNNLTTATSVASTPTGVTVNCPIVK
jgi:hypothetical protein